MPVSALETAELLKEAKSVIIVPGYGMAVAQAQHRVLHHLLGLGAPTEHAVGEPYQGCVLLPVQRDEIGRPHAGHILHQFEPSFVRHHPVRRTNHAFCCSRCGESTGLLRRR